MLRYRRSETSRRRRSRRSRWSNETTRPNLARAWRKHNNGNEIILAEYLTFVAVCRRLRRRTIAGQGYVAVAEQEMLRSPAAGPMRWSPTSNTFRWQYRRSDGRGCRGTQRCGARILPAADYATSNIYGVFHHAHVAQRLLHLRPNRPISLRIGTMRVNRRVRKACMAPDL